MGPFTLGQLALAVAVCGPAYAFEEFDLGKPECPCLSTTSPGYLEARAELVRLGREPSYGTQGCQAYDAGNARNGCQDNAETHCFTKWCYVDMSVCPVNQELCEAAGGKVGSFVSPYCRDRPSTASKIMNARYSYETCGSLKAYDTSAMVQPLAGSAMMVAHGEILAPWIVLRYGATGKQARDLTGVIFDIFLDSFNQFSPPVEFNLAPSLSTEASFARFGDSYTGCVHDVALGSVDICVGYLWRLPERERMAKFSPTLLDDYFYLVVPKDDSEDSVAARLGRPFSPFKGETWGAVVGCLLGMTVILWGLRAWEMGFAEWKKEGVMSSFTSFAKANMQLWDDFLHGQAEVAATTSAHRWFRLGFQFFLLVIMASYTASLASMLVVRRAATGKVTSIEAAIEQRMQICTPDLLLDMLADAYPSAQFVPVRNARDGPRNIYSGACGAAVMPQRYIDDLHAGVLKERDCALFANNELTADEAHCIRGFGGADRDDCIFLKVGKMIVTVPVAWPVSDRYLHTVSWAITKYLSVGGLDKARRMNAYAMPRSSCDVAEADYSDGLGVRDLGGTFAISFIIIFFGILVCLGQAACEAAGFTAREASPEDRSE